MLGVWVARRVGAGAQLALITPVVDFGTLVTFCRHRGGPMHFADYVGLDDVHAALVKQGVQPAKLLSGLQARCFL